MKSYIELESVFRCNCKWFEHSWCLRQPDLDCLKRIQSSFPKNLWFFQAISLASRKASAPLVLHSSNALT